MLLIGLAYVASALAGEGCQPLASGKKQQLESFIKARYVLPQEQTITLVESDVTDSECYRRLVFRSSTPGPALVLYLAPDHQHLVTSVMNLKLDPLVDRLRKLNEVNTMLTSGAVLSSINTGGEATVVAFVDFQCPYCKKFAAVLNELSPSERSRVRLVYRQLPLDIHEWAEDAAELSTCVAFQDTTSFWKLNEFLLAHQEELSKPTLLTKVLGFLVHNTTVDVTKVKNCISDKSFEASLRSDRQLAVDLGIRSTPVVYVDGQRVLVRSIEDLRGALHLKSLATRNQNQDQKSQRLGTCGQGDKTECQRR
jgi:protein-disulfide isomerase